MPRAPRSTTLTHERDPLVPIIEAARRIEANPSKLKPIQRHVSAGLTFGPSTIGWLAPGLPASHWDGSVEPGTQRPMPGRLKPLATAPSLLPPQMASSGLLSPPPRSPQQLRSQIDFLERAAGSGRLPLSAVSPPLDYRAELKRRRRQRRHAAKSAALGHSLSLPSLSADLHTGRQVVLTSSASAAGLPAVAARSDPDVRAMLAGRREEHSLGASVPGSLASFRDARRSLWREQYTAEEDAAHTYIRRKHGPR